MTPKYGIGDKVKIVNYGKIMWEHKDDPHPLSFPLISEDATGRFLDCQPDYVGKEGLVCKVEITQGVPEYGIDTLGYWFGEGQMELIAINPNR